MNILGRLMTESLKFKLCDVDAITRLFILMSHSLLIVIFLNWNIIDIILISHSHMNYSLTEVLSFFLISGRSPDSKDFL